MKRHRRAIVTVPGDIVDSRYWGTRVSEVPGVLGTELRADAKVFVHNFELNGDRFLDREDVHVYGPFASAQLLYPMLDPDAMALTEEQAQQLWKETDASKQAFASFLLNAAFETRLPALAGALGKE